jgi:hypothetical protein
MHRIKFTLITALLILFSKHASTQCNCSTPDIASLHGSSNAQAAINTANLTVGDATLSLMRSFAGTASADENQINNSQTSGDIGVRLGVKNAVGPSNYMDANYGFSQQVCGLQFDIWDIDETDQLVIEASYNGTPVNFIVSTGSCVSQFGSDTFIPDGPSCEVQVNGSAAHRISVTIPACITDLRIRSFDQGGGVGGSYTTVFQEGCTSNVDGGVLEGGPFEFCVGDGMADNIPAGAISSSGAVGSNSSYIVTDDQGTILGLPPTPSAVDFDGAGVGVCLVWHLSYDHGLAGLEVGMNANNLEGCFSLSNPISVTRNDSGDICDQLCPEICSTPDVASLNGSSNGMAAINNAGLTIGDATFTVTRSFNGTAIADENRINASQTTGDIGLRLGVSQAIGPANNMQATYAFTMPVCNLQFDLWDIDQTDEIIIEAFNDGAMVAISASTGSCVSASGNSFVPNGPACEVGVSGNPNHMINVYIPDCITELRITSFDQGNTNNGGGSYTVVLNEGCTSVIDGGTLEGGPFEFCASDGIPDNITAGSITLFGGNGANRAWIVTDDEGNILGLPPMPSAVDFDGAGAGVCQVWYIAYEAGFTGLEVGSNIDDFEGCYSLSNPITVVRNDSGAVCDMICESACSTPDLASLDGSNNGMAAINNAGVTVGNATLTVNRSFNGTATPDENRINASQTSGDVGLRLGVSNAAGSANNMLAVYAFSEPVCNFEFELWDIDQTDEIIIEAYNQGVPVNYTSSNGSCVSSMGNSFMPAGAVCERQVNGNPNHMIEVSLSDCITELKITSFDQGAQNNSGGSYTVVLKEGCTQSVFGGTLAGGPFEFCVSDGVADNIPAGAITLSGGTGSNSAWVVTDDLGNILGLPPMPSAVDFDGAGPGTCLIWYLAYENGFSGLDVGSNVDGFDGCYSLSNPVSVIRNEDGAVCDNQCSVDGGILTGGPFEFCAGDGITDNIPGGAIGLSGGSGPNSQWVITDDLGNILGLPPTFEVVDFDGAGAGVCQVWYLRFEDGLNGLSVGANVEDFDGCYDLSNPISVTRNQPEGGALTGGPFEFCVGDDVADNIPAGSISLSGNSGSNSQWIVTDDQGIILGLPPMPSVVNFDGAGPGICQIWHLSFEDGLNGLEAGLSIAEFEGCYSISNPVSVVRIQPEGGTLEGGPFQFCVGDGIADNIPTGSITLSGNSGMNSQWIVTDDLGTILGLPPMPSVVDFDGAGLGTCLIWHLSYEDGFTGLQSGLSIENFDGCYSLSNPISVVRNETGDVCDAVCLVDGGILEGGPFEFCVGDGVSDNIEPGSITQSGGSGSNSQWIVTDDLGNILGLPPMPSSVNFDGAGPGVCQVWYLSYEDGLTGLAPGMNLDDLDGCFGLSNPIAVIRNQPEGGTLEGGPFQFCVGDGNSDNIAAGSISLTGNEGSNSAWVVTDMSGLILGLPPMPSAVDFEGAGVGICLVWHLSFEDGLTGLTAGDNVSGLAGCYSLSNPVYVFRENSGAACDPFCGVIGGVLSGGPFEFCVGDGIADNIPIGSITLENSFGPRKQWVVTDDLGNILGLPSMPSDVNFEGAGTGTCLIWNVTYVSGLQGLIVGDNLDDFIGCYSVSNPITVVRNDGGAVCNNGCAADGGELSGGPFIFDSVGDGSPDMIAPGSITSTGTSGSTLAWVVTDSQGYILGLPPMPGAVDFDGAGAGTCLIWRIAYDGAITGAEIGLNANDIQGCFSLSNPVEVIRSNASGCDANGGSLAGGPFVFDGIGDGVPDMIPAGSITSFNTNGETLVWVVTDSDGYILGLPPMPGVVDFDGAGAGTCLIWRVAFEGAITGAEVGMNANDIQGCFSLSNPIEVIRTNASGCDANGGDLFGGPFNFVVDGIPDFIPAGSITLANSNGANMQWVVTDDQGNILGLPPMPSVVDFDAAGVGVCYVYNVSYDGSITGLTPGENINNLSGCHSVSNFIVVTRTEEMCLADGGELSGGPFIFDSVGDGSPDMIAPGSITSTGTSGSTLAWVVTDSQGYILGLPPMPGAVDFDGAGAGTCLIWRIAYDGAITGAEIGLNANDIQGCFSLSNPVEVIRSNASGCDANGGSLAGGPFVFDGIGDGVPDMIPAGSITSFNTNGETLVWVVTDSDGYILGLPPMPGVVDFDGAGAGTCLIWRVAFEGAITGAEVGMNANDIQGCFSLSNPIEVIRTNASGCDANGGDLFGGPFNFVVDGIPDFIPAGSITLANSNGANMQWVVTDDQGNILGLPPMPSVVDFDAAGVGVCYVYNVSYDGSITGLTPGENINSLSGCHSVSNFIVVTRTEEQPGPANIVISEIDTNGEVEVSNIGGEPQDISSYWLCDFPQYEMIGNMTVICGDDMILDPGESITVLTNSITISDVDGEMGLYINSSFGNPASIIDYVEWGFSGHQRSGVAVGAGIWTLGDFIPAFGLNAIQYDGSGDSSLDWPVVSSASCQDDCLVELIISDDPIASNLYETEVRIISSGKVGGGPVEFSAGDNIELHSGFEVVAGHEFQAFIEGCENE